MNAMAQFQEVSRVVEQTDGNAPREPTFSPCPQSGHGFIPLCQIANVLKLVKVDLHDNRSNSYPWRESWKPFWTGLGMPAQLGNLSRLVQLETG